jgi:hypothetical protein
MVQYLQTRLSASFAALSDATRRGVLEQLGRSDASITALADAGVTKRHHRKPGHDLMKRIPGNVDFLFVVRTNRKARAISRSNVHSGYRRPYTAVHST